MESSPSSTGELDNPVIQRAAIAIKYMVSKGSASGRNSSTMKIVTKIVTEALMDASEVPPVIAEFYMKQLAALMYWVATSEQIEDVPLPDDFVTTGNGGN